MSMNSTQSKIQIIQTNISGGGIFRINNVQSFYMVECRIENYIPKINESIVLTTNSYSTTINFAQVYPDLPENVVSAHFSPRYMQIPEAIVYLKKIKDFHLENCNTEHIIALQIMSISNVLGTIKKTNFHRSFFVDNLVFLIVPRTLEIDII